MNILKPLTVLLAACCASLAIAGTPRMEKISLNGEWEVALSDSAPDVYPSRVQVPGLVTMAAPSLGESLDALDDTVRYDCVWYRRRFRLDGPAAPHAELHLRARYNAEVWLNGRRIGYDAHSTWSFARFDVTGGLRYGEDNILEVRVGSWNTATFPSKENSAEWWRSTRAPGIWDDVYLELGGGIYADGIRVQPFPGKVKVLLDVHNASSAVTPAVVRMSILDDGVAIKSVECRTSLPQGSCQGVEAELDASGLEFWTPGKEGNAKLYDMEVSVLSGDGRLLSRKVERFGYRYIGVEGRDVLLNGSKILFRAENIAFVRALNRWSEGLYDEAWLRRFIRSLVQDYNFNYIRIHLGHAYSRLYDIADEEGLMIQDEWRFMHDSEPSGRDMADTETEFRRWIIENANHPAIVAWDQENEGNIRIPGLISGFRELDPTRLWSEQDFIQKHIYEYSEREVRGFEDYVIPSDKPYTILESCRLWTNEFGDLELREDFKTSRTASGWHMYYYTKDDLEQLLADIHADAGTFYRCCRIQAWSPFAVLSGRVNGHNFFKGDIIDSLVPQRNLLVLKQLNEPVGVSVRMNQAIEWYDLKKVYTPGRNLAKTVSVWNDFGHAVKGRLYVDLKDQDGNVLGTTGKSFKVEPYGCNDLNVTLRLPKAGGVCLISPRLVLESGETVEGVTRRVVVGQKAAEYAAGAFAFGGRHTRPEGGRSIFENYTRTAIPDAVQKNLIDAVGDRLVDKVKQNSDDSFDIQTSFYKTSKHIYISVLKLDADGRLVSSRDSEAMPYIMLPEQVRKALVSGIGAVPQDEARVTVKPGESGAATYEIKVVGFDHKFRMVITDDGTLKSVKHIKN